MKYCPLDLVEGLFRRYVVYPSPHALTAHVLWIAHTHLMHLWDITPRLGFFSAEPASGKSRALEVSALLASNPINTFSISGNALIRRVDEGECSIFIDEIDGIYGTASARDANSILTAMLNAGYAKGAKAYRCGDATQKFKTEGYSAFAPVMMAGLNRARLPDALKTRMICVPMKRRLPGDAVEQFRQARPIRESLRIIERVVR
jgi:hypothetical protein